MGSENTLLAKIRTEKGAGRVGRLRREGFLPAIFYGEDQESQMITLDYHSFRNALLSKEGKRSLFILNIEGENTHTVLLKDYQVDPIKRTVIHADFQKIDPEKSVNISIPIIIIGRPIGVERGGVMHRLEREVLVSAKPALVPALVEIDVSGMEVNDTLRFADLILPDTVELAVDPEFPVVTVVPPRVTATEEEESEETEDTEEGEGTEETTEGEDS